jgi:hypothetical protein
VASAISAIRGRAARALTPQRLLSAGAILTAIIVAGVLLRLYRLGAPVLDQHAFRQTQTASQIWLWDKVGFSPFEYNVPVYGGGNWVLEFPWYQWIVFGFTSVFGLHEEIGRLVSIAAFVAAAYLLFEIGRRLLGSRAAAVAAVAFLTFTPITVFYFRAYLIDPLLLAVALLMLLAAIRLHERFTWTWTAVFVASVFVCALGKANLLIIFSLPIMVLLGQAVLRKGIPWKGVFAIIAGVAVSAGALLAWTRHADALNVPSNGQTFANMRWWYFGSAVFDANLWHTVGQRMLDNLTVVGVVFVGIGLVAIAGLRSGYRLVLVALIVSNVVSVAIFANLNRIHDYYQLPYYATIALLGGLGVWAVASLALRISQSTAIQMAAGILAGLALVWTITLFSKSYFADAAINYTWQAQGAELNAATPDEPLVLLAEGADPNEPILLYEARRVGWRVPTEDPAQAGRQVRQAKDLGALVIQKGPSGVPSWVAPLAGSAGFRLTYDGPTFAVFSK